MPVARHLCILLGSALLLPAAASADVFYSNNFEASTLGPELGATARLDQGANFTQFLGRYSENTPTVLNNSVSLTLPRPTDDTGNPSGGGGGGGTTTIYTLLFDFYCIDAWHGNNGPDKLDVLFNGTNVFSNTFTNTGGAQTYQPPTIGPAQLGFGTASDSIYRDVSVEFNPGNATQLIFKWRSDGLTGISNESWGIDNVRVGFTVVPSPGSLALLGFGGIVLAKRRRR